MLPGAACPCGSGAVYALCCARWHAPGSDHLRAPSAEIATAREYYWKGRRWDGTPAPEGPYIVTLYARGAANTDSLKSLPIFVDVTPPAVQV